MRTWCSQPVNFRHFFAISFLLFNFLVSFYFCSTCMSKLPAKVTFVWFTREDEREKQSNALHFGKCTCAQYASLSNLARDLRRTVAWLRIRIAFALVRSAILCLRGGRSARHRPVFESREVAIAEARIYGDE